MSNILLLKFAYMVLRQIIIKKLLVVDFFAKPNLIAKFGFSIFFGIMVLWQTIFKLKSCCFELFRQPPQCNLDFEIPSNDFCKANTSIYKQFWVWFYSAKHPLLPNMFGFEFRSTALLPGIYNVAKSFWVFCTSNTPLSKLLNLISKIRRYK